MTTPADPRAAPRRIRVLWLVKGLGPGGAERLLVAAAGHHARDQFDITCAYLLPWKQQLAPELEALGVSTVCLGVRDERDIRWSRRLRKLLVTQPVDVLHLHSPYPAGIGRLDDAAAIVRGDAGTRIEPDAALRRPAAEKAGS